jgi:[ribosomal protein S5]-alanine N-acetyltransferase
MQALLPPFPAPFDLGNVRLRALTRNDTADWFAVLTDPTVIAQTSYDIRSLDAVEQMITHYCNAYQDRRFYRWAIATTADDRCLGTCGFYSWDATHQVALLGYELAHAVWGQGIMTHAVQTLLAWAYTTTAINRIQATVLVGHQASARVLEKQGFQREGTLREYLICRGQPRDFWMFSHLRHDYSQRSGLS